MSLNLNLVRHALALAQHGNFRRAARALHVSQPTLSRSIAALEASLGVRLFDRTSRGAEPTVFGQLILDRGRDLLAREADLLQEISMRAGLASGSLVVCAGPNPFEISVVDALTRLIAQHPGLDVQASVMHAVEVVRDVLAGVADVGVADQSAAQSHDRLLVEPLPEHPVYLACRPGHPLAGKRDLTPEEIDRYPLVATHVIGHAARYMAKVGARGSKYDPNTGQYRAPLHVNSYAVSRQIASGTDAITPGTAKMLAADVGSGRLVTLDFRAPELRTGYCLLLLKDRMRSPSAVKFIELLREVEAEVATAESRR